MPRIRNLNARCAGLRIERIPRMASIPYAKAHSHPAPKTAQNEDVMDFPDASDLPSTKRDDVVIRDGLYDRIPIPGPAIALISSLPFLRLDRIQQLGFVSRVWP